MSACDGTQQNGLLIVGNLPAMQGSIPTATSYDGNFDQYCGVALPEFVGLMARQVLMPWYSTAFAFLFVQ
jgi:hypothetical protein